MARTRLPPPGDLPDTGQLPVQAVADPILNKPYEEPTKHWSYRAGIPEERGDRRRATYWFTNRRTGSAQLDLLAEEVADDLPLVNRLREDVKRWRQVGYRGASATTRELLEYWGHPDRPRRLFFCQLEAIETLIYLLELRLPGRTSRTGFQKFEVSDQNLARLVKGERPDFSELTQGASFFPSLMDAPADDDLLALRRLGCKMATGSGKTIVMAMLIAWAFCNRGRNPASREFPNGALICCPNLTVKDRLQVLRPAVSGNYYDEFDLVPARYRDLLGVGRVLVTNWHVFQPRSPHREGDTSYRVVDKGEETNDAFALNRLGELAGRLPILVLNDESHHCWRPKGDSQAEKEAKKGLTAEEKEALEQEEEEARVWLDGLDRINNAGLLGKGEPCILTCVDLSATPFYLAASGHPEGSPFPWLVSDFGLVDAIESGIVKIPRLPVKDDTESKDDAGRPDPKYFRLWRHIVDNPRVPKKQNGKPKPEAVFGEAQSALTTLASQWKKRFEQVRDARPTEDAIPPVLIVVCDNTEIAEVFYHQISGERVEEVLAKEGKKEGQAEKRTVYGPSALFAEFANTEERTYTIQIDSRKLEKLEAAEGSNKDEAVEALRNVIATIGKNGQAGEHVRCVVSVAMLTEGWDASNVTHILGVRAFGSQLLCEQVVGRGLRRMNYTPDPHTGRLTAEHVDVYGIPFSLIPYKRTPEETDPEDEPRNHVFALPERQDFEMRLPAVESYVYALRQDGIHCDVDSLEGFTVNQEPTKVYLRQTRGYVDGVSHADHGEYVEQDRLAYYESVHFQSILFRLTQLILDDLVQGAQADPEKGAWARLQARHQLFPQIYRIVADYVERRVTFKAGLDKREIGLQKYAQMLRERVRDGILPAAAAKEAPLLPILNSFRPYSSTKTVDYTTTRPVVPLTKSHLNAAVIYSEPERWAIELLEDAYFVDFFTPNDRRVGLSIPYEYQETTHQYVPDFLVRVRGGRTVMLEIKGGGGEYREPDVVLSKNTAARKWIAAINNHAGFGQWAFEICHAQPGETRLSFAGTLRKVLEKHAAAAEGGPALPFRRVTPSSEEKYVACVPLLTLRAAAGRFSEEQIQQELRLAEDVEWVAFSTSHKLSEGMFVAQVKGKSMEPRIPDRSYCLFRPAPHGPRSGRILLVAGNEVSDPENAAHFTVKEYHSEKVVGPDDVTFRHVKITLKPLNPEFSAIVLTPTDEGAVRVLAEFVQVL